MVSTSTGGWLIDEPGFYKLQAAVDVGDEVVVSNVLRLYVAPPATIEESSVAPDYFTEDVGRVLSFGGAPVLEAATQTLRNLEAICADNPAARHARVARTTPLLRNFKQLVAVGERADMSIRSTTSDLDSALQAQEEALMDDANEAADTLGHITFFGHLREAAAAVRKAGEQGQADELLRRTVEVMRSRHVLDSVIDDCEAEIGS